MEMFKQTLVVFSVWILSYVWTEGNILIVTDGNYSIGPYNDDHYWLKSGPYFLHSRGHKMDTDSKKLQVSNSSYASSGIDVLGNWQDFTVHLHAERDVYMEATIRTYPNDEPNIVVFIQRFPRGLNSSRADSVNHTATGFPTFQLKSPSNDSNLAYLMFGGYMLGDRSKVFGRWTNTANLPDGLDGSGPLILYDEAGGVLLMSPMDNFMAASVWVDSGVVAWGVMGGVDSLPPGFTLRTLCYLGNDGVGQAFRDWGRVIREWYNKTDAVVQLHESRDITLTHLGYWTDNGAYYYYHTESGLNYEQTLYSVKQYAMARQLPYRYMQLDSWWYYKDSILAVTEWEAMKSVFPSGLRNLSADLQLPLAAHNRFWSVNTTYAKQNGGQFDFFIGKVLGLPTTEAFWNWLFKTSRQWGLILYEQDWLNFQLLQTELLQTNLTAGADWLDSMAAAAHDSNITVQYCMALSRHGLHSLKWPHITQARVTDDYHLYIDNWKIGITSHFSAALGLAPSKDTFWTTSVQSGNIYNLTEPYPDLQVAVATLSTGPVGPGDAINKTSREVLMRCCAADGVILKPSRPATAIDAMFLELGFGEGSGTSGEIWSTYSDFNDVLRFGIIFTANISRPFNITPVNVGFSPMIPQYPESILFERGFPEKLYNFSDSFQFEINNSSCNASFFCLFYTAPLITFSNKMQLVLLGELEKWVPMSPKRVLKVHLSAHSVQLLLHGQPLESVTFFYFLQDTLMQKTILIGQNGCGILRITSKEFDKDDSIYSNSAPDYCHFQLLSPNSG